MRAHAELIKKWLDDETLELEYLSDRDKWEPAPNPFLDLTALYREKHKKKKKVKEKKKVEKWQWAVTLNSAMKPEKIMASQFYKNTDFLREDYRPDHWKIICRIEGSRIEVEE